MRMQPPIVLSTREGPPCWPMSFGVREVVREGSPEQDWFLAEEQMRHQQNFSAQKAA